MKNDERMNGGVNGGGQLSSRSVEANRRRNEKRRSRSADYIRT